jgi:DNA-binding HxlR family transcriptional regulator
MINLQLTNFDILPEDKKQKVQQIIDEKIQYFNQLLKRYPTEVPLEIKFQKKQSGWKIDILVKLQSKDIYLEQSGKNLEKILSKSLSTLKNQIKKQKAIERKDYEYKRAKYRKKLLSQKDFELLIELHKNKDRKGFDQLLKPIYDDLQQDLKERLQAKGKSEQEAEKISDQLMEKIKQEIYETFTAKKDQREEFLDSISDISHYYENN